MNRIVDNCLHLHQQRWCDATDIELVEAFPVFDRAIGLGNDRGYERLEIRKVCRHPPGPCWRISKRINHLGVIGLIGGDPSIQRRPVIDARGRIEIGPIEISDLAIALSPHIPAA